MPRNYYKYTWPNIIKRLMINEKWNGGDHEQEAKTASNFRFSIKGRKFLMNKIKKIYVYNNKIVIYVRAHVFVYI